MGYACPVCETPQRDAEHLANHLAFTAMLHGDAHERWLDERVPEWADRGADDLAPVVADHADETDYDEVFEESIPERDHAHSDHDTSPHDAPSAFAADDLDGDAQRTLAEAREMTRAMLEADADADADADAETDAEGGAGDDGKV
jgi:hypothetical protein